MFAAVPKAKLSSWPYLQTLNYSAKPFQGETLQPIKYINKLRP